MEKLLLSIKEASEVLGLSPRSIAWLISTGQLESRKQGKRRLLPREAVEQWAKQDHPQIRSASVKARAEGKDPTTGQEKKRAVYRGLSEVR